MINKKVYNDKSREERNALVLKYIPAVKKMAYKLNERLPSNIEFDELYSIGIEELVKRSKFYDSSLNDNFWGYSKKRIYGSMLDFLRSLDTISRSSRKLVKMIDKEVLKYVNEHDNEPGDDYLSELLGESIEKIREAKIASEIYATLPMNDQLHILDNSNVLEDVERDLLIEKITGIIDTFKERDRMVIQLYYLEELSLKEISDTLNITQSRISQIHKSIVIKIRNILGVDGV
jgi:RNA polymerase sigma factor for flagellar operon FliA